LEVILDAAKEDTFMVLPIIVETCSVDTLIALETSVEPTRLTVLNARRIDEAVDKEDTTNELANKVEPVKEDKLMELVVIDEAFTDDS
jgi:hypothetical protein